MATAAYTAGQLARRRREAARRFEREGEYHGRRLEWPELRREILAEGGIGPSKDWDRADVPGDLYRQRGKPPDLVAAETTLGRSDRPPWSGTSETLGDDGAMMDYLRKAHDEWERAPASVKERHSIALSAGSLARRRAVREGRLEEGRRRFGGSGHLAAEQGAHEKRIQEAVRHAREVRRSRFKRPAIGFYTDEEAVVHPITASRRAGGLLRRRARGRPPGRRPAGPE